MWIRSEWFDVKPFQEEFVERLRRHEIDCEEKGFGD